MSPLTGLFRSAGGRYKDVAPTALRRDEDEKFWCGEFKMKRKDAIRSIEKD
jgi:hypothetical protein